MKTIVAFDFDGTLTKNDSFLKFIVFCRGKTTLYLSAFYIGFIWSLFRFKLIKSHTAKQIIFSYFFKGMHITKFNAFCEAFSKEIDAMLREGAVTHIKDCLAQDNQLTIVSASIENWIKPWALKHNIETVIATKIEVDAQGLITGKFNSLNCVSEEKVNRFLKLFPNREKYRLIVFGDSEGDRELMNLADESFFNYFK